MDQQSKALPRTVEQAVKILLADLSLHEKTVIADMQKDDILNGHVK